MEQTPTPLAEQTPASPLPQPPGRISGVCRTRSGEPLAGLRINVFSDDGIVVDTQLTGADGRFATRLLFAGSYRVEARDTRKGLTAAQQCRVRLGEVTRLDFTFDL